MTERSSVTIDLTRDERLRLETEAQRKQASVQDLVREAVDAYLDHDRWMTEEIRRGLAEADAGDVAREDEARAVFDKWRG